MIKDQPESHTLIDMHHIVAIGASAGGLEAIHALFDHMPPDTGFSFVVIQHLSPDHKSLLVELLGKHTAMKVVEATNDLQLEPNTVYVIPSRKVMTMSKGKVLLHEKSRGQLPNTAIDTFLESLAADLGPRAIAVILSGTGTDGTKGIHAVKNAGGVVIVQDPVTAAFDGMPNSAIASGKADFILPPEMIAEEMVEAVNQRNDRGGDYAVPNEEVINEILKLIHETTSHDFTHYKSTTIGRRLKKRMAEKNIKDVREYLTFLQNDIGEVRALCKQFLIAVTSFFRDPEAFAQIRKHVLPGIFSQKQPDALIKVWVVATSTGEEAYSLAILIHEFMQSHKKLDHAVKVFATDIDSSALEVASRGYYPESIAKDLDKQLLEKYFIKEGNAYRVVPMIRKMVVFAYHDILKDPPFSRLDLITCRNLLIYLNPVLQKNILRSFHFALNNGGYLFLGPSENVGILKSVVKEIDRTWKIYQCTEKNKTIEVEPLVSPITMKPWQSSSQKKLRSSNEHIDEIFRETLLEEHKIAGILVDREGQIKHATGNFKNFLKFPDDHLNLSLVRMLPDSLSGPVNICMRRAMAENQKAVMKNIKVREEGQQQIVSVIVKPYLENKLYASSFLFVIFYEENIFQLPGDHPAGVADDGDPGRLKELENELRETRENLQALIEELESTNEELQSGNEEIISANEELQSTNEELQSLNEELHTVNTEHQAKIKELIELNDDLNNYFNNSAIGQILVDKKLTIRKFSPAVTKQVNLVESDIGRSLEDITFNVKNFDIIREIKHVINSGGAFEREVISQDGAVYLTRITPYVRTDKSLDGAVVNFINITETKRLGGILEGVFNSSLNGIVALEAIRDKGQIIDFEWIAANTEAEKLLGRGPGSLLGKRMMMEFPSTNKVYLDYMTSVVEEDERKRFEFFQESSGKWLEVSAVKMMDGLVMTFTDISQQKKASELLAKGYEELKATSSKLQATNVQLEQSNFDLLQFASVASHDLQEPLRKIQAFGNLLQTKAGERLGESERYYLDKIIASSNRMQRLIEDVLTLSKLSNKNIPFKPTDLNSVVKSILEDLEITIKEKNAKVTIGSLPSIDAVSGQMHQLFQNLLSNALKFNNRKNPEIEIVEKQTDPKYLPEPFYDPKDYVMICVRDNGIGFEEEFREKIFGVFQRLHNNAYQGTGIGLAICKKIVDNHNGFIKAEGKLNEGSSFYVILPKVQVEMPAPALN